VHVRVVEGFYLGKENPVEKKELPTLSEEMWEFQLGWWVLKSKIKVSGEFGKSYRKKVRGLVTNWVFLMGVE